jgi:hypothetical protein
MPDVLFLELMDHIGVEPSHLHETDRDGAAKPHPNAGEPGPLTSEAFSYAVPVMVKDPATGKQEVGSELRAATIEPSDQPIREGAVIAPDRPTLAVDARIIPGTRIIETTNPQIASILAGDSGGYTRVDPPKSSAQTRAKAATGSQEG